MFMGPEVTSLTEKDGRIGRTGRWKRLVKRQEARKGLYLGHANVAELADAQDLGSCPERGAGSTPAVRITRRERRKRREGRERCEG